MKQRSYDLTNPLPSQSWHLSPFRNSVLKRRGKENGTNEIIIRKSKRLGLTVSSPGWCCWPAWTTPTCDWRRRQVGWERRGSRDQPGGRPTMGVAVCHLVQTESSWQEHGKKNSVYFQHEVSLTWLITNKLKNPKSNIGVFLGSSINFGFFLLISCIEFQRYHWKGNIGGDRKRTNTGANVHLLAG